MGDVPQAEQCPSEGRYPHPSCQAESRPLSASLGPSVPMPPIPTVTRAENVATERWREEVGSSKQHPQPCGPKRVAEPGRVGARS